MTEPKTPMMPPPYLPASSPSLSGVRLRAVWICSMSNWVPKVELTQLIAEVIAPGSCDPSCESCETKTCPKSSASPAKSRSIPSMVIPVARPRFMPRWLSHSTTGSIAIDSSHASSSRKRKLPIAWKAHVATESRTTATTTMTMMRLALPGVMAIHRASSSNGTPGTAWLVCRARLAAARWFGWSAWWRAVPVEGSAGASGWSALTRRAYGSQRG